MSFDIDNLEPGVADVNAMELDKMDRGDTLEALEEALSDDEPADEPADELADHAAGNKPGGTCEQRAAAAPRCAKEVAAAGWTPRPVWSLIAASRSPFVFEEPPCSD